MHYTRISADCHIDMPWLPPDLFTSNASARMKDRMPYVADGPDGPHWTAQERARRSGSSAASAPPGTKYVPGQNYRVDVMAATGLYDDGKKGHPPRRAIRTCASRTWTATASHAEVHLRHPRRGHAAERPRGGQRDVPHLQRLARTTSAATIPTGTSAWRACRTATSTPRSQEVHRVAKMGCAASSCRARGTWSRCGIRCGSRSGRRSTR